MERIETVGELGTIEAPSCTLLSGDLKPCQLVIFGASGDLTARKLIPALFALFVNGNLPHPCSIVGCGRTVLDNDGFRRRLEENSPSDPTVHPGWNEFRSLLHYRTLEYHAPAAYRELAVFLKELDRRLGTGGNTIFDLAVPPDLYPVISARLAEAGLAAENVTDANLPSGKRLQGGGDANHLPAMCTDVHEQGDNTADSVPCDRLPENEAGRGWTRIIIEKPFGHDLASARLLDKTLHRGFSERRIFRIDHYLAKETVQNIMMFRFANSIFEPLWNRDYIDYVGIVSTEELGIGTRAGYYDRAGVLRDMFQNHMLQLLAMVAMDPPAAFNADRIRDEKIKLLRCLRPFTAPGQEDALVLGQYGAGTINGRDVPGYRGEPGVRADSLTPTFAMMRAHVDNWRWQGVPFFLISGKRMARKDTRMVIQFKEVPHSLFRETIGGKVGANRLTFGVFPEEEINLSFQAKMPGPKICLRDTKLGFRYHDDSTGPVLAAYEKVLLDCMRGEQMFFWRQDGVELAWEFIEPVLELCEQCSDRTERLKFYEAGSWGPEEVRGLMGGLMS